jgi:hypothetical protein
MQENKSDIAVRETKSSQEEWLDEARRLEEQGKYEQAEQIRAKYLGYDYISPEQLETIAALALDPAKKEAEVKKERKQLFSYATHHRRYDWIEQLSKLNFQRAILYMKELRSDRKEYEKHLRLGNKAKVSSIVQKYGVDFTLEDNNTGLMTALYHGQDEIVKELLDGKASVTQTDKNKRCAFDYMLSGYFGYEYLKHKQQSLITEQTLVRFWEKVRPQEIVYECDNRQFHVGSHSMLFILIYIMRNTWMMQSLQGFCGSKDSEKGFAVGAFDMNSLEALVSQIPDEILPPYRKKRSYINSIMALHEQHKDSPYCKSTFVRVERGAYIINPYTGLCRYPVLTMEEADHLYRFFNSRK